MAGIGTTVVEAAALGRRAVGVEVEPRWAEVARANLDHVLDPAHRPLAEIRVGDARNLGDVLGDLAGTVDLVCTSPPYACDVGNMDKANWGAGGDLCPQRRAELLDRQVQPRPRPRRRLRDWPWPTSTPAASPCSDPAGCSSRSPSTPDAGAGPSTWPGSPASSPAEPGSPTSPTSSPSTRRSATATSSPGRRSGRPPKSARLAAGASPPISPSMRIAWLFADRRYADAH